MQSMKFYFFSGWKCVRVCGPALVWCMVSHAQDHTLTHTHICVCVCLYSWTVSEWLIKWCDSFGLQGSQWEHSHRRFLFLSHTHASTDHIRTEAHRGKWVSFYCFYYLRTSSLFLLFCFFYPFHPFYFKGVIYSTSYKFNTLCPVHFCT